MSPLPCWEHPQPLPSTSHRAAHRSSPNPCPCVLPPLLGCRGAYEQSHCCFSFPPAGPGRGQTEFEWEMCWPGERGKGTQHLHPPPPPPGPSAALGPSTQRGFCRLTARCWVALHVQSAKPARSVTSRLCEDGPLLPQTTQFWFGSSWGWWVPRGRGYHEDAQPAQRYFQATLGLRA